MKKSILIFTAVTALALLTSACGGSDKPGSITRPLPSATATIRPDADTEDDQNKDSSLDGETTETKAPKESEEPSSSDQPEDDKADESEHEDDNTSSEDTKEPNNTGTSQRKEISKMIQDAEDLIADDLTDDAKMIIEVLLSRDLTDAEAEKVKELQTKVNRISD